MNDTFINALSKEIQPEQLLAQPEALIAYSLDATRLNRQPKAVFFPYNTDQLSRVMKLCQEHKVAVVPRGSATGLSGGAVPTKDSLVISFTKMNNITNIDETNLLAEVEPGVITANLQRQVLKQNLFYPPDPSSANVSTIGGNIAEGAGGPRALRYGVTRDYVMGLEVVLADGSIIKTGGLTYKNVTGLDLTRLMVASEGTLGLITKATLKLLPAPPESLTYLLSFKSLIKACQAPAAIIKTGILPTALEIMDKTTIDAVAKHIDIKVSPSAQALLLVEIEKPVDAALKKLKPLDFKVAGNEAEASKLWAARRAALPALSSIAPSVILEDATVPRSQLAALVSAIQAIAKKHNLIIGCFGHAGDGNLHPTIVTDLRDKDKAQAVDAATAEIFKAALKLGGTLTGEHGIGLIKKDYLEGEIGPAAKQLMQRIKKVYDPTGLLNPGKIFNNDLSFEREEI